MDSHQQDYCVMDCGEEELDKSQEKFYSSKLKSFEELLQLAQNSQAGPENELDNVIAVRAPASATSKPPSSTWRRLERNLKQSVPATSTPSSRPYVALDTSVFNQLASNNSCIGTSSAVSGVPVAAGVPVSAGSVHNMPALVPSVRLKGPQKTSTSSASHGTSGETPGITLQSLLSTNTQSSVSPGNGPLMRHPAPPPPQPQQHIPTTPSPAAPVSKVRVMAPVNRALSSAGQISVRSPSSLTSASSSQHLKVLGPSSINNLPSPITGPRVRLPIPPKSVASPSNNGTPMNTTPILQEMKKSFTDPACELPIPGQNGVSNKGTIPSPNLPLLPETRPEAASDCRPRPRPGPASRTRPKPPENNTASSACMQTSDMVDLTHDDQPQPNSKKAPIKEKTFPSLIVTARASLKIFPSVLVNNERLLMDNQIRKVMQMAPSVFTEYLLQQRLLKAEQVCEVHHKHLRLGIYSDPNRYAVSGGYVWIGDCCKFVCHVYSGSLFDKTLQPPTNIIKLMYHWACNTAVHNVLNWVKVDSYIIKTYNTFFRAVCTAMIHQKFPLLGGSFKKIQVGVISVGTYPDGATKEVKVDIMAVMDPDIPQIRLKVLENFLSDSNKVYESKFRKILEVLKEWVHPESTIITDFAVDMHLCREYGFSNLVVSGGRHSANNNNGVMDYMRAKIPVIFQNTLGLLSYTIIQQFLDELVWRETWGPFPSRAYDTLVKHIAELTKLPGPDLISKLKKIASEPTKNWKFSVWNEQSPPESGKGAESGVSLQEALPQPVPKSVCEEVNKEADHPRANVNRERPAVRPLTSLSPAVQVPVEPGNRLNDGDRKIFLDAYYYGLVEGNPALQKRTGAFLAECVLCKRDFLSASSFTNHLIHHALNDNATMAKASSDKLLTVCPVCCKTVNDLESHKNVIHPSKLGFMCKICRLDLKTEEKLVKHMCFVHQELDMPYKCDVCHFQTSIFDNAMKHFKDCHDKDSYVRCPYCLKMVRFSSKSGLDIASNQYYFVQHVQKHSVSKLNRKCEKCVLSFNNMGTLKQHQEKVHMRSGRLLKNVRHIKSDPAKMLIMPLPNQAPLPPVTLHENSFHTLKGKALSSSVKVPEYYSVCSCLECDGPMTQNHFSVKMTCTKCSFQSCCPNAIREHSARHHHIDLAGVGASGSRSQILGGSASLDRTLYCSYCTYSSTNGNKMATHIANCGDGGAVAATDKRKLEALVSPLKIKHEIY